VKSFFCSRRQEEIPVAKPDFETPNGIYYLRPELFLRLMIIHKTLSDFILFVYVHISHSDSNYDPSEMAVIKTKMGVLFPEDTDIEQKLYTTIREYNSFDKSRLEVLFSESIQHFKEGNPIPDATVFTDIQEIIRADGKVKVAEVNALTLISSIIRKVIP